MLLSPKWVTLIGFYPIIPCNLLEKYKLSILAVRLHVSNKRTVYFFPKNYAKKVNHTRYGKVALSNKSESLFLFYLFFSLKQTYEICLHCIPKLKLYGHMKSRSCVHVLRWTYTWSLQSSVQKSLYTWVLKISQRWLEFLWRYWPTEFQL